MSKKEKSDGMAMQMHEHVEIVSTQNFIRHI